MSPVIAEPCLCTSLRQAARRVSQHYDAALVAAGLSANQFGILSALARGRPSTIQALAKALVMDRSTLGHLLRPLQLRHLVRLVSPDADRRRREIHLTPEGLLLIEQAQPLWRAAQNSFESAYGAENALALRADLARVCATETADVRHP